MDQSSRNFCSLPKNFSVTFYNKTASTLSYLNSYKKSKKIAGHSTYFLSSFWIDMINITVMPIYINTQSALTEWIGIGSGTACLLDDRKDVVLPAQHPSYRHYRHFLLVAHTVTKKHGPAFIMYSLKQDQKCW